jgi:hypothetical protein
VFVTIFTPVLLAGGLWFGGFHGWWSEPVRRLQAATIPYHVARNHGCDERIPVGKTPDRCKWQTGALGKPIYLVGDSHADHFSESLVDAARALKRPLVVATTNGCPFVDFVFQDNRTWVNNTACRSFVQDSLTYLQDAPHGLVVIANSDIYWSAKEVEAGTSFADLSNDPSRKAVAYREGLRRTVEALRSSGQKVLLIQTIPRWADTDLWDPTRCSLVITIKGRCSAERTLESFEQAHRASRSAVDEVANTFKVGVWDPATLVCVGSMCSTDGPHFVRYRDGNHISVQQAVALAPDLERVISSMDD